MRKTIIFAAAAALLTLVSCSKEETFEPIGKESQETVVSEAPVFTASIAGVTKTTVNTTDGKLAWEKTDEITVKDNSGKTAIYKIDSIDTDGHATFVIKDKETALGAGPYTAIYGTEPAKEQAYSATAGKLYMTAPETSTDSFTFTVQCGLMKINLTKAGESVKSIAVTGTPADGSETTYTLAFDSFEAIGSAKDFYIALPAGCYTKIEITNALDAVCTLRASGVEVGVNHIRPVTFGESKLNFVSYLVDLGLSVKWATCNLGALEPGRYGDYYQWGGTADVSDPHNPSRIDYANCPFHTGSEGDKGWLKYIPYDKPEYWSDAAHAVDNKLVLDPEDDAAHAKLGGNWRMPTKKEWEELLNESNCTWTWDGDRKGYIVTSKKTGYEGRSIFLPAAGYRNDMGPAALGEKGSYWFPSLNADQPKTAQCIRFEPGKKFEMGSQPRYMGFSIRPVYDISSKRPDQALPGVFSISDTRKVYFSKGNLWADGSNALHFEDAQWVTATTEKVDKSHVSHFTWSDNLDAAVGDSKVGNSLFCDKNHMQSVDGSEAIYYALSHDEWKYLFSDDNGLRRGRYKYGVEIHGKKNCVVIAPDNWDYLAAPLQASYTDEEWARAESAGLVCFPAAGSRSNSYLDNVGTKAFYWSSSAYDATYAYMMYAAPEIQTDNYHLRHQGCALRLVTDVKE